MAISETSDPASPGAPAPASLEILYRSPRFVAVDKPAGLFVHRSKLDGRETANCLEILRRQLDCWLHPVHRLDRPTSGVLLFAFDSEAAARLSTLLSSHEIGKSYLAVVRGHTAEDGVIDRPMRKDFEKPDGEPVEAVTAFKRLATVELPIAVGKYPSARYSLVRATPLTGRRHQIRRHLASCAHPVIGDRVHGDGRHNRFIREHFGIDRLLLHAEAFRFRDPFTDIETEIRSKSVSDFNILIRSIFSY